MKRKVLLIVIASFMIMGVVSAASLWGNYKGNPIIKVNIDGKQNNYTGVPAIAYGGQVLLPISTLKSLGVTYKYDTKTLTANITSLNSSDASTLKSYAEFGRFFSKLENLGDEFLILDKNFFITVLALPNKPQENLNSSFNELTRVIEEYNKLVEPTNTYADIMSKHGFLTASQDVHSIMKYYFDAIDFYKLAYSALETYNTNSNYATNFFDNLRNATEQFEKGYNLSESSFEAFQSMIQEYKLTTSSSYQPTNPEPLPEKPITVNPTPSTINSRIDGDFDGFEYDKIFILENGQIWKQTSFDIRVSYKYSPKVTIFKDGYTYYMLVDGIDKKIKVEQVK